MPQTAAKRGTHTRNVEDTRPEISQLSITESDIHHRAYELYQVRGAADGQDWADWFQAEQELREAKGRH